MSLKLLFFLVTPLIPFLDEITFILLNKGPPSKNKKKYMNTQTHLVNRQESNNYWCTHNYAISPEINNN